MGHVVTKKTVLDPILVILRVTEAIAVGIAFARALAWEPQTATLGFAFSWTELHGRKLQSWANPEVHVSPWHTSHDSGATSYIQMTADTPWAALAPYVAAAIKPLLIKFDGYQIPLEAVEHWVKRLVERRLS
jgi:hypothetical protein